mgnify:CR=1 FL=1
MFKSWEVRFRNWLMKFRCLNFICIGLKYLFLRSLCFIKISKHMSGGLVILVLCFQERTDNADKRRQDIEKANKRHAELKKTRDNTTNSRKWVRLSKWRIKFVVMIWYFLAYLAFPGHTAKLTTLKFTTQMQGWLEGEYLRKHMGVVFSVYSIFHFNGELWAGRTWNGNILLVIQEFWQNCLANVIVWMVTLFNQRSKNKLRTAWFVL